MVTGVALVAVETGWFPAAGFALVVGGWVLGMLGLVVDKEDADE